MFRNCLAAALRHLSRNRLYTAISVFGLAVGLWGALLTGLTIRSQYAQNHFIPGYERIYQVVAVIQLPGLPVQYSDTTLNSLAPLLQLNIPQLQGATRLTPESLLLRHGAIEAGEQIYWVDPNFFALLRLPIVAGDLAHALARPDGIVLPRSMARKYFGRDDPIGQTVMLADARQLMGRLSALGSPRPMVVTAVVEDMPQNGTEFQTGAFASGLASFSKLNRLDHDPTNLPGTHSASTSVTTFLRLAPGASIENVRRSLQTANLRSLKYLMGAAKFAKLGRQPFLTLEPIRLDRLNSHPGLHPDFRGRLIISIMLGGLILLIGCVNFINLMTARAARRSREVGIRKLAGAGRHLLMLQFLGESTLYVLTAMLMAVALTEWSLPYANAFLGSDASFDYWRNPALLGSLLAATALLGALAGVYPALIMSGFRPLSVLKGLSHSGGAGWVRQGLVTLQFAILVALVIGATVIYQQRIYATTDALRIKPDQVLGIYSPCRAAFVSELKALPGVQAVACSGFQILGAGDTSSVKARDGADVSMADVPTDLTVFDLYGLKPLAGAFGMEGDPDSGQYVINESAVRQLHFASAQAAIGQTLDLPFFGQPGDNGKVHGMHIVAVVPDFTMGTVERPIPPTAYVVAPAVYNLISVKLTGWELPQTLVAIDRAWTRTGGEGPINRFFMNEHIEQESLSMLREAQGFGIFTIVAALLACLGLFGLAASIAEGRTREIGIRKALGADTSDIIRLLLWQFSRPVLWANLLAWPVAAWAMQRWLQGFAYHVNLALWLFPAAGGLALAIALLTVCTHSVLVARAKPVAALRYE
ncbi:MAG TPA: FtsX-like permease family protein [Steroidobacteraceae bacterium]|nr:FtsX-like permease family protein [Steroidobacteraceae bacterium]